MAQKRLFNSDREENNTVPMGRDANPIIQGKQLHDIFDDLMKRATSNDPNAENNEELKRKMRRSHFPVQLAQQIQPTGLYDVDVYSSPDGGRATIRSNGPRDPRMLRTLGVSVPRPTSPDAFAKTVPDARHIANRLHQVSLEMKRLMDNSYRMPTPVFNELFRRLKVEQIALQGGLNEMQALYASQLLSHAERQLQKSHQSVSKEMQDAMFRENNPGHHIDENTKRQINQMAMPTKKKAKERYVMWHDRQPSQEIYTGFRWPTDQIVIGQATAIGYTSDKWGKVGENKDYIHKFDRPYPRLILQKPPSGAMLPPDQAFIKKLKPISKNKRAKPPKARSFVTLGRCLDIEYIGPDGMIRNLNYKNLPVMPFLAVDPFRNLLMVVQEKGNGFAVLLDSPIVEITPRGIEN